MLRLGPSKVMSTDVPAQLRPGMRVQLHSLKSMPELNGVNGRLKMFYNERDRWGVILHGHSTPKLLRPQNLTAVSFSHFDVANLLIDILGEDIVIRMCAFLPGRALLDVGTSCAILHERLKQSVALWESLCTALLGEALVCLHKEEWKETSVHNSANPADFWRALFRTGYIGKQFRYADSVRNQCMKVVKAVKPDESSVPPDENLFECALSASGHTACALDHRIAIIGGWRPHIQDETLYVCAIDLSRLTTVVPRLSPDSMKPERRMRHSSCVVRSLRAPSSNAILVLGGCNDKTNEPCSGLNALLFFEFTKEDCSEILWWEITADGEAPRAIWHHAAGSFGKGRRVVVFGGDIMASDPEYTHIGDRAFAAHVYILELDQKHWCRVTTRGQFPKWRSLHTGVSYSSLRDGSEWFVIMGGCEEHLRIFESGRPATMVGYNLHLDTFTWQCGRNDLLTPAPRMRFAAERYGRHLLVCGGHGADLFSKDEPLLVLNLLNLTWSCATVTNMPSSHSFTPASALAGGCLTGGVAVSDLRVSPIPKLDVISLCPPEEKAEDGC